MTTPEAAKRLKLSIRRVRAMIDAGLLKAHKIGRDWVIEETTLEKFAATPRRPGRPKKPKY